VIGQIFKTSSHHGYHGMIELYCGGDVSKNILAKY